MPWATATVRGGPGPRQLGGVAAPAEGLSGHLRQRLAPGHQRRRASPGQGPPWAGRPQGHTSSRRTSGTTGISTRPKTDGRDFEHDLAIARRAGFRNFPELTIGVDRLWSGRPAAGSRIHEAGRLGGDRPDRQGGQAGEPAKAAGRHRRRTALHGRQRLPGRPVDRRSHGRDDDRYRRLQRLGPVGQLRCGDPLQARELRGQPALVAACPEPPIMPPGRFDSLPDLEITRSMKEVARRFWDRSTRRRSPIGTTASPTGPGPSYCTGPRPGMESRR